MTKEERIKVFEETLACAKNWKYTNPDSGEATELFREDYDMHYNDAEIYNKISFRNWIRSCSIALSILTFKS